MNDCLKHGEFIPDAEVSLHYEYGEDLDDEVPLSRFFSIVGNRTNIDEYMDMDIELLVCQLVSDEDIITDLLDSRRTDRIGSYLK